MNDDSRVVCHTPTPGKKPTRIHKWKYDLLRGIILDILDSSADGVEFRSLPSFIDACLNPEQRANLGSVGWYTTTVKLDMEVQGDIERIPNASPQRLRLVERSRQPGANAESRSP
ncbi:MAG: hypothetical protein OXG80_01515 [Chloroflexi bacterium]|nr:hypothetical protein [Chloroflexota bacterium]